MGMEILYKSEEVKRISAEILELNNIDITTASGKSKESNDGMTAKYSDSILNILDNDLNSSYKRLIETSNKKFNYIAESFKEMDESASVWGTIMTKTYTSDNLIVGVTYYTNRINSVKKCCSDYEKIFDAYIKYLNEIKDTAIVSGETAKALAEFIKQVESLKGDIEEIGKRLKVKVNYYD